MSILSCPTRFAIATAEKPISINAEPTVNEIALSILRRMNSDVLRDQQEWEFAALSPEEQEAERKRAEESNRAWKKYISELKAKRQGIENMQQ